jgi:hypothetical protein
VEWLTESRPESRLSLGIYIYYILDWNRNRIELGKAKRTTNDLKGETKGGGISTKQGGASVTVRHREEKIIRDRDGRV